MIYEEKSDNIVEAAFTVTRRLLNERVPEGRVFIKPNIVRLSPPPVTTDVRVIEGIVRALVEAGKRDIVVAEGSGEGDSLVNLNELGYSRLGVRILDFDREKTVSVPVANHRVWERIHVPAVLLGAFIISVPVLKEHTMCRVSLSLKNMVGVLPERFYSGYWSYKKSMIHREHTDGCIADIVSIMRPAWAVVDGTIGMRGSHLCGCPIKPPVNRVFGSSDPFEADCHGCGLLGIDWREVAHLRSISGVLQSAPEP